MIGMKDVLLVSPMIVLFISSLVPIAAKVLNRNRELPPAGALAPAFLGLVLALVLIQILNTGEPQSVFGGTMVIDGLFSWISTLVLVTLAGFLLIFKESVSTSKQQFSESIFLVLNSTLGGLILLGAADLITVFIGLEMMSLSLYVLIAISNEQKLAKEAAFKYFILGSFASAIFLYGMAFLFGTVGSTALEQIGLNAGDLIYSDRLFVFGLIMVIIGFCFKVSIVPFHAWTPDVYQGAPTPLTAFMATAVKAATVIAFLRFMGTQSITGSDIIIDILQWLCVLTMFLGNIAAILQDNLKRMLAYSSVAHSGYMMMAILVVAISDEHAVTATQGLVFYLFAYSFMTFGAFAAVSFFEKYEETLVSVDGLRGAAQKFPLLAFCMTLFLLSLAGIPPTIGFFGKLTLFSPVVAEGLYWLAIWGVVNSVISVYYYLRPVVAMYMTSSDEPIESREKSSLTMLAIFVSAMLVVLFGLMASPIYRVAEMASF